MTSEVPTEKPPTRPLLLALLKCDIVGSVELQARLGDSRYNACKRLVQDAVESSSTGHGCSITPQWEGDGCSTFFSGGDAPVRAVEAALDAVTRVRIIPEFEVQIRASVGADTLPAAADPTKESPPGFNQAGRLVGSDVCPPSAVCVSEDVYFTLRHDQRELASKFAYLGSTKRNGIPAYTSPPGKQPTKPGGLRTATQDAYREIDKIRASYNRPPFSHLRFYRIHQFNFLGSLDLLRVFSPLRMSPRPAMMPAPASTEKSEQGFGLRRSPPAETQDFAAVFARRKKLVILGDSGAGKTTLLRYAAIVTSCGRAATKLHLGVDEALFPLYAGAAEVLEAHKGQGLTSAASLFASIYGARVDISEERLVEGLAELLQQGRCLFLIDGLDEMPAASDRAKAADLVENLAHANPLCRFVVASRPAGYPGMSVQECEEYVLEPLRREQARELARALYVEVWRASKFDESTSVREGTRKGDELMDRLGERATLTPFRQNPLLLSLAALVHLQLGELPRYRVKLYEVAVQTLVEAWARARRPLGGEPPFQPVDYDTEGRAVLPCLAFHMQQNCPGGIISNDELLRQVAQNLPHPAAGGTPVADTKQARDFLTKLDKAGSLLAEYGPGQWRFIHSSFQEYLAARYVAGKDEEIRLIDERLFLPRWEEVIRLTAGVLGVIQDRPSATSKFIRRIIEDTRDWRAVDLRLNKFIAARCLADTVCRDPRLEGELTSFLHTEIRGASEGLGPACERTLLQVKNAPIGSVLRQQVLEDAAAGKIGAGILQALRILAGKEAAPILLKTLLEHQEENEVLHEAANGLSWLHAREAVPDLIRALANPGADLRKVHIVRTLGRLDAHEGVSEVSRITRECSSGYLLLTAAETLSGLGEPGIPAMLTGVLRKDSSEERRDWAAYAIGSLGASECLPALKQGIQEDPSPRVRASAAAAAVKLGAQDFVPMLLKTLESSPDSISRINAVIGMSFMPGEKITEALRKTRRGDKSPAVRALAASRLHLIAEPETVTVLIQSLATDSDEGVQADAARALGNLRARKGVDALLQTFRNAKDGPLRTAAGFALERITESLDEEASPGEAAD